MARKLLLVILVLLLVGALGVPYYFGMKLEELHAQEIARANAQPDLQYETLGYSRGWFKSEARDRISGCSAAGQCVEIDVDSVMHHGPIAITGIMDGVAPIRPLQGVGIARVRLDKLVEGVGLKPTLPALTVTSIVELDSTYVAMLDMPSSQHTVDGKTGQLKLSLGGASGKFNGTAGSLKIRGDFRFPSLKLEDSTGFALAVDNVTLDVDGESTEAGFIGKVDEKLGSLTVASAADDPQPFALESLSLTVTGARSGDGLSQTRFTGEARVIKALGQQYGPATLDGELLRVNRAAMTRMQKELQALEKQNKPPQEMLPAMIGIYQKHIPEVLKSRPEFNLKSLRLKMPDGDLVASLKLVGVPPHGEMQMGNLLQMLQADFNLQVPAVTLWNVFDVQMQQAAHKAAAQNGLPVMLPTQADIGAKIDELVKANVWVPKLDANAYVMEVALLDGRFLVNGQENPAVAGMAGMLGGPQPGMPLPGVDISPPPPAPGP